MDAERALTGRRQNGMGTDARGPGPSKPLSTVDLSGR